MIGRRIDGITLAAILFMGFLFIRLMADVVGSTDVGTVEVSMGGVQVAQAQVAAIDNDVFASPYKKYTLTQGLHGQSYGHLAIDIAAGKGAKILAPINGVVSARFIDQYGNTTLVIENEHYEVLMLHGNYSVAEGEQVAIGQVVGKESNNGYTTDMAGRSCAGRDCGYHTHLNVYDKELGKNVNPLNLIQK
jgi:murein DD-endopeptidase MepM/ murein hydrolase activator NlpD